MEPNIDDIRRLDGKIYAMLSPKENVVFNYFVAHGRKHCVSIIVGYPVTSHLPR